MKRRTIIVCPSFGRDSNQPLGGDAGVEFERLAGLSPGTLYETFDVVALLARFITSKSKYPIVSARRAYSTLLDAGTFYRRTAILLVSWKAIELFGVEKGPYCRWMWSDEFRGPIACIPHPLDFRRASKPGVEGFLRQAVLVSRGGRLVESLGRVGVFRRRTPDGMTLVECDDGPFAFRTLDTTNWIG